MQGQWFGILLNSITVCGLHDRGTNPGLKKFPVHAGDIGDGNLLGAFCFTFSFIGAVAETKFIHSSNHGQGPASRFRPSLAPATAGTTWKEKGASVKKT